jgi:hypothetical protein
MARIIFYFKSKRGRISNTVKLVWFCQSTGEGSRRTQALVWVAHFWCVSNLPKPSILTQICPHPIPAPSPSVPAHPCPIPALSLFVPVPSLSCECDSCQVSYSQVFKSFMLLND